MVLVRSTYGLEDDAAEAARRLVDERLACCVHVSPIRSLYRWQGRVEDGREWVLEARTTPDRRGPLVAALEAGHPYDTPLVEVLGASLVTKGYADWAHDCLRG